MPVIKVKDNESFEVAMKRFKKQVEKAGILTELRRREYYDKPSIRKKKKAARRSKPVELIISKSRTKGAVKKCNVGGEFYEALGWSRSPASNSAITVFETDGSLLGLYPRRAPLFRATKPRMFAWHPTTPVGFTMGRCISPHSRFLSTWPASAL